MKKKSGNMKAFYARNKHVDYRDDSVIINEFNDSIRQYKRFETALNGGDEELAVKKIRDAADKLFRACEWTLKNYLHRRYIELEKEGQIKSNVRISKTDKIQSNIANLAYCIDDFEEYASSDYNTLGI